MKVAQESPDTFKPVTITLETQDELDALNEILADTSSYSSTISIRQFATNLYDNLSNA